jgi:hypothetical protein
LLLHPLDFLCGDDVSELKFFPGMGMPFEKKLALVSEILSIYAENFEVVSMGVHAAAVRLSGDTKRVKATVIGQTS